MNYYISDLHFGCINDWDRKTLAHDDLMVQNWNATVTQKDDVWVLGDIGREGKKVDNEYLIQKLALLKGRKHLIRGNHDLLKDARIAQQFVEVCDYKVIKDASCGRTYTIVLSHFPILMWEHQHKGAILLYGHTHNSKEDEIYRVALQNLNIYFEERTKNGDKGCPPAIAINVGAMKPYMNWCPQSLKTWRNLSNVGLPTKVQDRSRGFARKHFGALCFTSGRA